MRVNLCFRSSSSRDYFTDLTYGLFVVTFLCIGRPEVEAEEAVTFKVHPRDVTVAAYWGPRTPGEFCQRNNVHFMCRAHYVA